MLEGEAHSDPDGKEFKVTKGAPQVILALSANTRQMKPAVEKAVKPSSTSTRASEW